MQNRAMREYAARRGWAVVMQVKEAGSGGAPRAAREKLLEAARRREIDSVLVWRMDPSLVQVGFTMDHNVCTRIVNEQEDRPE